MIKTNKNILDSYKEAHELSMWPIKGIKKSTSDEDTLIIYRSNSHGLLWQLSKITKLDEVQANKETLDRVLLLMAVIEVDRVRRQ